MTNTFIVIEQHLGEITQVHIRGSAKGARELGHMLEAQGASWGVDIYRLLGDNATKIPLKPRIKSPNPFKEYPDE